MQSKDFLHSLLKTPQLFGVQVSPDKKWVAWSWSNIDDTRQVYLAPTDGSADPIKVTSINQDVWVTSWSPDSNYLLVEHDIDGDERIRIFQIDVQDISKMASLTEEHPPYFIRGGDLTPDNNWLVYGANFDFEKNEQTEPTYIYKHNLKTGEKISLAKPKKPAYFHPCLNHQGTHVLYHRKDIHPSGAQVWVVDIDGNEDREILNAGDDKKVTASWLPDGRRLIFLQEEKDHTKIGVYDLKSMHTTWLVSDPDRHIEDAFVPLGSEHAVIIESKQARTVVSLININTLEEKQVSAPSTSIPISPIRDNQWVALHYSSTQPNEVVLLETNSEGFLQNLSNVWKYVTYSQDNLVPAKNYEWESTDGMRIQGWLYRPKATAKGTLVFIHGGPSSHSEDQFNITIQYLVSEGFAVLDPNYRGSTGFGLPFKEAIKKDGWGGMEQVDIATGIESLIQDGIAEAGKTGVFGTSYGGYSAWHLIAHYGLDVVKASVPICGMTDLVVDYYSTRPDLRPYSEEMLDGTPETNPDKYHKASPINFIQNIKGHLLIVQGLQDPNVTPRNVEEVEQRLQQHNIHYDKLVFEDEGHGISRPKNQEVLLKRLAEFFLDSFS